jgi:hypothetical protein
MDMSIDLHVCWRGQLTVDPIKLKSALDGLGFDATVLHDDFDIAEGFWPIEIAGFHTGVEIQHEKDLEELTELYPVLAAALDGRDKGVTFTWRGDAAECGTGLAFAAALGRLADVIIYEPSEGVIVSSERCTEDARQMFEEAKKEQQSPTS